MARHTNVALLTLGCLLLGACSTLPSPPATSAALSAAALPNQTADGAQLADHAGFSAEGGGAKWWAEGGGAKWWAEGGGAKWWAEGGGAKWWAEGREPNGGLRASFNRCRPTRTCCAP